MSIINADVAAIFFSANLPATGHSITIWRGNFSPTITTNGKSVITINNGLP